MRYEQCRKPQRERTRPVESPKTSAEYRKEYLVPIYVRQTSDIPPREAHAAFLGITDALIASGQERQLINIKPQDYDKADKVFPTDDYIEGVLQSQPWQQEGQYGQQVDARRLLELVNNEAFQQTPHWEILIANTDFSATHESGELMNFVYGATDQTFPSSVQSLARIMHEVPEGKLRDAMIRRVLRHETGHMFGLPGDNRSHLEENLGVHCTNVCSMRQGLSTREWAELTIEEHNAGIHFCDDCKSVLGENRLQYKALPTF